MALSGVPGVAKGTARRVRGGEVGTLQQGSFHMSDGSDLQAVCSRVQE